MIRFLIFMLSFSLSQSVFGQNSTPFQFDQFKIDSIRFQVERNRTLEMTLPQESVVHEVIGNALLTAKDCKQFLKKMRKNSTYAKGRALLTHDNLSFTCYSETAIVIIQLSTLTRNMDISGVGEPYYGKFSKKFGKFLIQLLIRYGWYDRVYELGDLEGISD